ncbi:MAG: TetR/AcrR family transcriptional regulator [Polyangiaceae bacterium]
MVDIDDSPSNRSAHSGSRHQARTEAILRAALEELAESGYSALSFEAVAARVGIAKTTVYRRYPTKTDLVRAALRQFVEESFGAPPDTGSLRGDLIALGRSITQFASSMIGQGLFRTRLLDRVAPEVDEIGKDFERENDQKHRIIGSRAVRRGELDNDAEIARVMEVLSGWIICSLALKRQSVSELEIARTVDLLLNGVSTTGRSKTLVRT